MTDLFQDPIRSRLDSTEQYSSVVNEQLRSKQQDYVKELAENNQKRKIPYTDSIHPLVVIVGLPVLLTITIFLLFGS